MEKTIAEGKRSQGQSQGQGQSCDPGVSSSSGVRIKRRKKHDSKLNCSEQESHSQISNLFSQWTESAQGIFKKSIQLRSREDSFQLPDVSLFYIDAVWQIPELLELKKKLNDVKGLLNDKKFNQWHEHTRAMNPGKYIQHVVKKRFNPEYCSQAWGKFMEIISTNLIIPDSLISANREGIELPVNSVHLCEAPGAFVSATNHFIKTTYNYIQWNWLATTLNPYHEQNDVGHMINEDKLILTSPEHWTFLQDNTGNIINKANIDGLVEEIKISLGAVHFVTADGSIDCQSEPGEQENSVAHLHFAEIVAALLILEKGGSFVLKIFTFFESPTICHLYLLSCVFREVKLIKPVMSKEGNSEVYVICLGYFGRSEFEDALILLSSFIEIRGSPTPMVKDKAGTKFLPLFQMSSISPIFIQKIKEAAEFLVDLQISTISRNLAAYKIHETIYPMLKEIQLNIAEQWVSHCNLGRLEHMSRLSSSTSLTCHRLSHVDILEESYSFTDLQVQKSINFSNFHIFQQRLEPYANLEHEDELCVEIEGEYQMGKFKMGKPYTNIYGSRFCYGKLLLLRQDLRMFLISNWEIIQSWANEDKSAAPHCPDQAIKLNHLLDKYFIVADELKTLRSLCFYETMKDLAEKTDVAATQINTSWFIHTLKNMNAGESMFLCEFPLLTRLHVGIIFGMTVCFQKVILHYNQTVGISGVFLSEFKGVDEHPNVFNNLEVIFRELKTLSKSSSQTILECLETQNVYHSPYVTHLLNYNVVNVIKSLRRTCSFISRRNTKTPILAEFTAKSSTSSA